MAKKTIQVNIAAPCHEDWNKMTATQCGAFCKACSKEVIDFTNKSDAQIVDILSQAKGKVCGRFTADKLGKPISKFEPDPEWYSWKKWAIAAGILLGVGSISAKWADTNPVATIRNNTMRTMGEPAIAQMADTAKLISDSTYNGLLVADTSVAVGTTCTRLVKPFGIDTTIMLMGDTIIHEEDTTIVQPPMPEIMGLVAPVIMGKIASPQKEQKPKKDR